MLERQIDTTGPDALVETDESRTLIASDKVAGTTVYDLERTKIGHVHTMMIDKRTGQVAQVIISDGGFLSLAAERFLPVSWSSLVYDDDLAGYRSELIREVFEENALPSADEAEMAIW